MQGIVVSQSQVQYNFEELTKIQNPSNDEMIVTESIYVLNRGEMSTRSDLIKLPSTPTQFFWTSL